MCGISGILNVTDAAAASRAVERMVRVQRHRGPDGSALVELPGAVLGHNRLAIIDLSVRASQPMVEGSGRYWIVLNGEIYNYVELAKQITADPRQDRFNASSDTAVLLAAYCKWGRDCVERIDGMFAFCIYDLVERTAFLARDRFGQKPLHYVERDGQIHFASEIKALLAAGIATEADEVSWARYLAHAKFDDTEATFFKGIRQVLPGCCATVSEKNGMELRRYYTLPKRNVSCKSMTSAASDLRDVLRDVVRCHMRSDVEVGVSLSGGIDSSALLSCMKLAGCLGDSVKAFSVEFDGDYSERRWIVANTRFHNVVSRIDNFDRFDFHSSIEPMMWHQEAPIGGLMNCALMQVMRSASGEKIKVLQDGTGLDELFGGYRLHHAMYVGTLSRGKDQALFRSALAEFTATWGLPDQAARAEITKSLNDSALGIDGTSAVRPELLSSATCTLAEQSEAPRVKTGDELSESLEDYLLRSKIPRNMRMKDRLSMAYGIEIRLPFLDHQLAEFATRLEPGLFFKGGLGKSVVREALVGFMDEDTRTAPKRSVHTPQGAWLRQSPMKEMVQDILGSRVLAETDFLDVAKARAAYADFVERGAENSLFVWQWINLYFWFSIFSSNSPISARPLDASLHEPDGHSSRIEKLHPELT